MILWQLAQGSTFRCSSRRWRNDVTLTCSASFSRFVSIPGGGTGAATIKSHHNVGGLPEDLEFELVEPLRALFKDEVRAVGAELAGPLGGSS